MTEIERLRERNRQLRNYIEGNRIERKYLLGTIRRHRFELDENIKRLKELRDEQG